MSCRGGGSSRRRKRRTTRKTSSDVRVLRMDKPGQYIFDRMRGAYKCYYDGPHRSLCMLLGAARAHRRLVGNSLDERF
jgi:hypothetical protein